MPRLWRIALWGVLLALTLGVSVWGIGYLSGGYRQFFELARPISVKYWTVLAIATVCFYLLDYARLYTLFALLGIRVPLAPGMEVTCVTYFVSSLTPTAELNIPASILVLRRLGIRASQTAAVAVVKTFYMTIWVCLVGFGTLLAQDEVRLPPAISDHIVLLTAPAIGLIVLFLLVMFFPDRVLRWTASFEATGPEWKRRVLSGIRSCAGALSQMGRSTQPMHLAAHFSCVAFILVYVFIGATLCEALGIPMSPRKALAVFSNSLLVSYLSPVPGSIGVTEVLTSYFIDPAMTERGIVASTLLRFLCAYIVIVPGAVLLLNAVREVGWRQMQELGSRRNS